jgi:hypothetical protein
VGVGFGARVCVYKENGARKQERNPDLRCAGYERESAYVWKRREKGWT